MDDEQLTTSFRYLAHKVTHKIVALHLVNADAVLDRHRNADRIAHGFDAIGHQLRFGHQTRAKRSALHPLRGASAVQVDFAVAPLLAKLGGFGQVGRFAAAQLQSHRLLFGVEVQVPRHIAVQQRTGGDHLGVKQRVASQQTVEVPAMPVGPVHHGGDAQLRGTQGRCHA